MNHYIKCLSVWFTVTILLFYLSQCDDILCNDAYECQSLSITSSSGEDIECRGDHSCSYGASITVISADGDIFCQGAYACFAASVLNEEDTTDAGDIFCSGLYSCANINDYVLIEHGDISCEGEKSCYNGKYNLTNDCDVFCYGDLSCAESTFYGKVYHSFWGYRSGMNTMLYSTGDAQYQFLGRDSGFGATIVCNKDDTCRVDCYDNGCQNVTLICDNCYTFEVECNYNAEQSDVCPDGENIIDLSPFYDEEYNFTNLVNVEMSTIENSIDICSQGLTSNISSNTGTDVVECGDYQDSECYEKQLVNENGICCNGYFACREAVLQSDFIRCDGVYTR